MLTLKLGISNTWHLHSRNRQHSGHVSLCPELPCAPGKPLKRTTCRRPRDLLFESLHLDTASSRKTPLSWFSPSPPPCKVLDTRLGRFAYLTLKAREMLSFPSITMQTVPSHLLGWLAITFSDLSQAYEAEAWDLLKTPLCAVVVPWWFVRKQRAGEATAFRWMVIASKFSTFGYLSRVPNYWCPTLLPVRTAARTRVHRTQDKVDAPRPKLILAFTSFIYAAPIHSNCSFHASSYVPDCSC